MRRIANEGVRARLKEGIVQADAGDGLGVVREINCDYARANGKGVVLPLESL